MFILLTANCVVVVYKWLFSNFKNLEDTKNDDYQTDRAFFLIIDICYFAIMFVLALIQVIVCVACCLLFKKLRAILKPNRASLKQEELDNSEMWRKLEV